MKNLMSIGLAGVTASALIAMNVMAQDRPQRPQAGEARSGTDQAEVQITLRPVGAGQFEVFIDGNRVEGRLGERLLRATQEQRADGALRGPGDRAARGGRGMQGDATAGDRPAGPPGTDRAESDQMPPFRQRVGQYYDGQIPELTDELLQEVLIVIKDFDEALYARLASAVDTNPEVVKGRLQNDLRRWMAAVELKRNDPELYELNVKDRQFSHETTRLIGEYQSARRADDAARADSVRSELRRIVGDHFDVRQKLRERDLAQLEMRLEFLRKQVQQRLERRAEIISEHLSDLLGGNARDF